MPLPPAKFDLAWPVLAVLAIYANVLWWGVFQFDDYNVIVGDAAVHSWATWWNGVGHGIRPLLKLSYTVDWASGWGTAGFHFTNLAIHAANCVLVWQLTRRFAAWHAFLRPHVRKVALATTLLFAVHPAHTEAVSYISGRSSSLMTMFYLGALLAYFAGRTATDAAGVSRGRGAILLYGVVPALFIAAVAVKETAMTLPFALLLVSRVWPMPAERQRPLLPWMVWLAFGVLLLGFVVDSNYATHAARSLNRNDGWGTLATQANGFFYLMGQWCWPLHLNIDPDLPRFDRVDFPVLQMAILIAMLMRVLYWVLLPERSAHRPWLDFALAWLVLHLALPYLLMPRLDVVNERQLYLVGWPLLMAAMAELALFCSYRRFLQGVLMLVLAGSVMTVVRNRDYYSEIALWEATAARSPEKSRVHNNLGYAYLEAGRHEEARQHFVMALQLDPENYRARFNLERLK